MTHAKPTLVKQPIVALLVGKDLYFVRIKIQGIQSDLSCVFQVTFLS